MPDIESDDLGARCREVLEWHRTGLLIGNGALRRLAASLSEVPEKYRLDVAEKITADEAMRLVAEQRD